MTFSKFQVQRKYLDLNGIIRLFDRIMDLFEIKICDRQIGREKNGNEKHTFKIMNKKIPQCYFKFLLNNYVLYLQC